MNSTNISIGSGIGAIYWIFAIFYAFMHWGILWGLLNIVLPFAPLWDLAKNINNIAVMCI